MKGTASCLNGWKVPAVYHHDHGAPASTCCALCFSWFARYAFNRGTLRVNHGDGISSTRGSMVSERTHAHTRLNEVQSANLNFRVFPQPGQRGLGFGFLQRRDREGAAGPAPLIGRVGRAGRWRGRNEFWTRMIREPLQQCPIHLVSEEKKKGKKNRVIILIHMRSSICFLLQRSLPSPGFERQNSSQAPAGPFYRIKLQKKRSLLKLVGFLFWQPKTLY